MKLEFFKNYRFVPESDGTLKLAFVCRECGKVVTEPGHYSVPVGRDGSMMYHLADFVCEDCMEKED